MADFSLKGIVKKLAFTVVIGLIVVSFLMFGITDIFTNQVGRSVAVVGGEEITTVSFQQEYDRTINRLSNERGQRITAKQAKAEQIDQQVLGGMIVRRSIQNHALALGVTTSDKELIEQIKNMEAFNGILDEFDEATFLDRISQSGFTRLGFESGMRKDMTNSQLLSTVVSGMEVPRALAEAIISDRLQRREASYVVLAPDLAGQIDAPTDEQLNEHYQATLMGYNVPEIRDFTMLLVRPSDFTADLSIPDEEVRELYDLQIRIYTTPEKRDIERLFGTEEAMRAARSRIEAGESFLSVGTSLGLTEEEIQLGEIEISGIADTAAANAAFGTEATGLVGPIQGLSWSLLRVSTISPEVVQTYEEVAPQIREALLLREAERSLGDQLDLIDEGIASGVPLEDLAATVGLSTIPLKGINRSGETVDGVAASQLPEAPELLKEVFASTKNFDSDLIEYGDGAYFVVRVDEIYPSAPKAYEEVKPEVLSDWQSKQRVKKLEELAKDIVVRGNGGTSFESLATEVGRGVLKTPGPLTRNQTTDLFSSSHIRTLFSTDPGVFFFSRVELGESLVVMRMDKVVEADAAMIAPYTDIIKQQLDEGLSGDLQEQYLAALSERYKSSTNAGAIAIATGQASQPGF